MKDCIHDTPCWYFQSQQRLGSGLYLPLQNRRKGLGQSKVSTVCCMYGLTGQCILTVQDGALLFVHVLGRNVFSCRTVTPSLIKKKLESMPTMCHLKSSYQKNATIESVHNGIVLCGCWQQFHQACSNMLNPTSTDAHHNPREVLLFQ